MTDEENRADVAGSDDRSETQPVPRRKEQSDQVSAWVLTAWMVAAPLLMLITIWVLTIFRRP
jgi:hypothetical protein